MIGPFSPKRPYEYLSSDDLDKLHRATLQLMERVGLEFGSAEARRILAEAGCRVDEETKRVLFPSTVVEKAIEVAPGDVLLAARDP